MTVQIILANTETEREKLQMCLVVAINHLENACKRSECARNFIYHDIMGKDYILRGAVGVNPFKSRDDGSWLNESSNLHIERFNEICEWVIKPFK